MPLRIVQPKYEPPPEPLTGPVPQIEGEQKGLFEELNAKPASTEEKHDEAIAPPPEVRRSDDGSTEDQARAEAASEAEGEGTSQAPKP